MRLLVLVLLLLLCAGSVLAQSPGPRGVYMVQQGRWTREVIEAFRTTPWLDGASVRVKWSELEPSDGRFDLTAFDEVLAEVVKWNKAHPDKPRTLQPRDTLRGALLGPRHDDDEIRRFLDGVQAHYRHEPNDEVLCDEVASALAQDKVIGWFQGRMEFGPRALGNRSIVADPRRKDMKDILNTRIKHRETYRPFAPSVLEERTAEWFERSEPSPFMLMVYQVRPERRAQVPAITHADGSGRLQTVSARTNPRYHALIGEFERQTGVGLVLNTSFNEHEPIVCTPGDALQTFLKTKMDVLVLGDHYLERA